MAAITPVALTNASTPVAFANATGGGDTVANPRGRTVFHVRNGDASSKTVTIAAVKTTRPASDGFPPQTVTNISIVVPAGEERAIQIPMSHVNDEGKSTITYSAVTSVTVAAYDVQP